MFKKIKALLVMRKQYKIMKEVFKMKDGMKTSEFKLTVIGSALTIWGALQGLIPHDLAATIVGCSLGVYTIARSVVKITSTKKDDEFLDSIEKMIEKDK
jgi:hypothetical protein